MRRAALCLGTTFLACASGPVTVTGELSHGPGNARGSVRDCSTGEVFELGVMASAEYVAFFRRAHEVAALPEGPDDAQVIVDLEGVVSDGSPRVLSVRRVIAMRHGTCDDPPPGE
jgi:hypothetical protein